MHMQGARLAENVDIGERAERPAPGEHKHCGLGVKFPGLPMTLIDKLYREYLYSLQNDRSEKIELQITRPLEKDPTCRPPICSGHIQQQQVQAFWARKISPRDFNAKSKPDDNSRREWGERREGTPETAGCLPGALSGGWKRRRKYVRERSNDTPRPSCLSAEALASSCAITHMQARE